MAKVASMAWMEAARPAAELEGKPALHSHYMTSHNLAVMESLLNAPADRNSIGNPLMARVVVREGAKAAEAFAAARARGENIRVISGIRDPVARSISILTFFADFCGHTRRSLSARGGAQADEVCAYLAHMWHLVLADAVPSDSFDELLWHMIGSYRTWFDAEFNRVFGVDVFAAPLLRPQGGQRLSGDGLEVLIYRAEDLPGDAAGSGALRAMAEEFLGTGLTLPRVNTAESRRSHALYAETRQRFRLPGSLLDEVYGIPIIEHFYDAAEIAAFKSAWYSEAAGQLQR